MNEDDYIKRVNPENKRVLDNERPNLDWGDMYGVTPKSAKLILYKNYPGIGRVNFFFSDGNVYATAFNPDLGEEDTIGYCVATERDTDLHLIASAKGLGIGKEINYQFRKRNPYHPSGGLTDAGERAFRSTYRRLVKDRVLKASNRELTAALSFMSSRQLDKKYNQFFNNLTLGFEAEISAGKDFDDNSLDEDSVRENFEFTKTDFLRKESYTVHAQEMLDQFDIDTPYGISGEAEVLAIRDLYNNLRNKIGFRVVALPMESGEPIMEDPSLNGYQSPSTELRHFCFEDKRLINVKFAIKKALECKAALDQFLSKIPLEKSISFVMTAISECPYNVGAEILRIQKPSEPNGGLSQEADARRGIYNIGLSLNKCCEALLKLRKYAAEQGEETSFILVKTEKGGLKLIDTSRYDDQDGILAAPLVWTPESHSTFEELYNDARGTAEREAITEAYGEIGENSEDVIGSIYRNVVEDVDSKAKMSVGYHTSDQFKGKFTVVEGDSSILPPGAEIVSPVFDGPVAAMTWLEKVFDMIENCDYETNKTTGLHVNIGTFKSISQSQDEGNALHSMQPEIDVLKLAILSGDHYLLDEFGRFGNDFTKSLAANIEQLAKSGFDLKAANKGFTFNGRQIDLRENLKDLNRLFIRGQTDRYATVNMQHLLDKGYLEFRIAGGANYHVDKAKVRRTVYRFMQLCAVACDPQAYFKEYMTELYKRFVGRPLTPHEAMSKDSLDKTPLPKTAKDALNYIRLWASVNKLKTMPDTVSSISYAIELKDPIPYRNITRILSLPNEMNNNNAIAQSMTSKVLYAYRLLMITAAQNFGKSKDDLAKEYNALSKGYYSEWVGYGFKPSWVRYIFTGRGLPQELTAMQLEANQKTKREHHLRESNSVQDKEFDKFYEKLKRDPKVKATVIPEKWEWDIFADCYYTARLAGQSNNRAQQFAKAMFWDYVNNGRKDEITDPQLKALYKKYTGRSNVNLKKRSAAFRRLMKKDGDTTEYIDWETWEKENKMEANNLEAAADGSYTNTTKKTKLFYYANRSTPQVCKPGQTVKPKAGYGKRTSIKTANEDQVKLMKKGGWVRDREDGKAHNHPSSKTSKYRPQLAKKQRAARKRKKMAASDTTGIKRYLDFMHDHN